MSRRTATDLEVLVDLLDLAQIDEDRYCGEHPAQVGSRTFGGQLVAQALIAAGQIGRAHV